MKNLIKFFIDCTRSLHLPILNITTFPILSVFQNYETLSKELKPVIESIITSPDDTFTNILLCTSLQFKNSIWNSESVWMVFCLVKDKYLKTKFHYSDLEVKRTEIIGALVFNLIQHSPTLKH